MEVSKFMKLYSWFLGLDIVWKIVVLFFYLFPSISYPPIVGFEKGIKYPQLQLITLILDLIALGFMWLYLKKPYLFNIRRLKQMSWGFFVIGIVFVVLSLLYSSNVIQTNIAYFLLSAGFINLTKQKTLNKTMIDIK